MFFSRRSFVRNAGLLSVASSLPLNSFAQSCTTAPTGFRLFFAGAWLFLPDPQSNPAVPTILAATVDPTLSNPKVDCGLGHIFEYGKWVEPASGDSWSGHPLTQSPALSAPLVQITQPNAPAPAPATLQDLFAATTQANSFVWVQSDFSKGSSIPLYTDKGVYAIRIPMPWSIVPTAYRTDATIMDTGNVLQHPSPSPMHTATTHVLMYPYATTLSFGEDTNVSAVGSYIDYHFHAVPIQVSDEQTHAERMFQVLFTLIGIDTTKLYLSATPVETLAPFPPDNLPCVTYAELGYPTNGTMNMRTHASTSHKASSDMQAKSTAHGKDKVNLKIIKQGSCCLGGGGGTCTPGLTC